MKAVLSFDMGDYDDRLAHLQAVKAKELVLALNAVQDRLRYYAKYDAEKTLEQDEFIEILDKYNIDLQSLLQ